MGTGTFCAFIGSFGNQEILLCALVALLLFGGKKIPEVMRGLGEGIRNFKEGMHSGTQPGPGTTPPPANPPAAAPPAAPVDDDKK